MLTCHENVMLVSLVMRMYELSSCDLFDVFLVVCGVMELHIYIAIVYLT